MNTPQIDKSTWGDGPWQTEPDRVDFVHAGFACFALRHERYGHWCGYVGVPKEHPLYESQEFADLEAHQGVNYAAKCDGELICHVPQPGMPDDVWWFGFDCGRCFDISPGMVAMERQLGFEPITFPASFDQNYRELPYVRKEIESLAEQLRDYKKAV